MTTKAIVHKKAVEYAACDLIENGITTKNGYSHGIDLILDNDKTILIRGMSENVRLPLINGSLDTLKSDYIIIVTKIKYTIRNIYILKTEDAKRIACNNQCKRDMCDDWFINPGDYKYYKDDYTTLMG